MKKTMIALIALAGAAMATEQLDSFAQIANNNQGGFVGFTFKLSDAWLTSSSTETEDYSAFELTSITLQAAETWYRLYDANNDSGLVVLNSSNAVVGKSTWDPTIGSKVDNSYSLTYSFLSTYGEGDTSTTASTLTLDLDAGYTVLIYGNKSAFDNLSVGTTITTFSGSQNPSETAPIVAGGLRIDYDANGTSGVMLNNAGSTDVTALPVVSFNGKLVPEPTTATLSLLALAGLAARRRRR